MPGYQEGAGISLSPYFFLRLIVESFPKRHTWGSLGDPFPVLARFCFISSLSTILLGWAGPVACTALTEHCNLCFVSVTASCLFPLQLILNCVPNNSANCCLLRPIHCNLYVPVVIGRFVTHCHTSQLLQVSVRNYSLSYPSFN